MSMRIYKKRPLLTALSLSGVVHLVLFAALRSPESPPQHQPQQFLTLEITEWEPIPVLIPEVQEAEPMAAARVATSPSPSTSPALRASAFTRQVDKTASTPAVPLDQILLADFKSGLNMGIHSLAATRIDSLYLDDADYVLSHPGMAEAVLVSTEKPAADWDKSVGGVSTGPRVTGGRCVPSGLR